MPCHTFVLIKTRRFSFVKTLQNIQSLHEPSAEPVEHLSRTQLVSHMHRDYLYGKLSNYRFLTASLLFHFDGAARSWITSSVMVLTQAAVVFSHSMDSTARFKRNCLRDGHRAGM